ncbi:T9SS type B sorting domain-containing protein [Flagellimonas sp. 2504JD4-2]
MRVLIAIITLLFVSDMYSQREAANWYFGTFAGLDFNSGTPQPLLDGQIRTAEGCETFSDANGNLLFYTEGNTVWNRFHEVMPNGGGLGGSFSTTQSALVVPNPSNSNIYYIFTPDDALVYMLGGSNGFNYSTVNMALDGGKGDVTTKNFDLLPQSSEKVSAVLGPTGDFYWVITHYRDSFYAYRVDGAGVNTTPVMSRIGPLIDNMDNIRGAMKISPNGEKLAVAHTILSPVFASSLYLFDFNTATGVVSNGTSIGDDRVYYGVEFSSDSSMLYASGKRIAVDGGEVSLKELEIAQFDLTQNDIQGSEYIVQTFPGEDGVSISGNLQIAIDKKIYHAVPNENLSVIRTPNLRGIDCDFRAFGVDLGARSATYGLPPFVQSFFETIVTIENFCEGETTTFTTDSGQNVASIQWDFGDPASGASNYSSQLNTTHVFSAPGTYTVTIDVSFVNGPSKTFLEFVEIAEVPNAQSRVTLVQCDVDGIDDGLSLFNLNEAITLYANGNPDMNGLFFESLSDAQNNVNHLDPIGYANNTNGQMIYARAFENAECFTIVEVVLEVQPLSDLGFYDDFVFCASEEILLAITIDSSLAWEFLRGDFPTSDAIYLYGTKEDALLEQNQLALEERVFGPLNELAYYFRIEDGNSCEFIGRLGIEIIQVPDFESTVTASLCNGETVLMAPEGYVNYEWSPGLTGGQSLQVNQTGEYSVTFSNAQCEYSQTFLVDERDVNNLQNIEIRDFQKTNEVVIHMENEQEDIRFSMDGGNTFQQSNHFVGLNPGIYDLEVDLGCTILEDTVIVGGLPPFFTPNNDGFNDIWTLPNDDFFPNFNISIFDRYGKILGAFNDADKGWDGNFNNQPMPSDDYWYKLELEQGRLITGYFTLKR